MTFFTHKTPKPRRSRRARLALHPLEDRTTPAGNVIVQVTVLGDLVVTGDGNPGGNQITVNETAAGQFLITGVGTQVNGGTSVDTSTLAPVTRDLRFTFGAGADSIALTAAGSATYRDVIAHVGGGADTFSVSGLFARNATVSQPLGSTDADTTSVTSSRFSGNVTVTNQNGLDITTVNSKVAGTVTINNLDGGDTVTVDGQIGLGLRVLDTVGTTGNTVTIGAVVGGLGTIQNPGAVNSTVTLNGAEFVGSLSISNGSGGVTATTTTLIGCTVLGPILITGGTGEDEVVLDAIKTEFVTLNLGNGDNQVDVENGTAVAGRLSVNTAGGDDNLFANVGDNRILSLNFNAGGGTNTANISGLAANRVFFNGGGGNDTLLANDANRQTQIVDDLNFVGREGTNTLRFTGKSATERSLIGGRLLVSGGTGVDSVTLEEVNVYFTTGISLGAGNDVVKIDDTRFYTPFSLLTGAGDDSVEIDFDATFTGKTEFLSDMALSVGLGTDHVRIAGNAASQAVLVYGFVSGDFFLAEDLVIGSNAERLGHGSF